MRTLAIGDIHGAAAALDALLAAVRPAPDDRLVFLGDYVDRGPDSKGVLDRLIALPRSHRCVFLRGNHELMMARARQDRTALREWLSVGGDRAMLSYSDDGRPPVNWDAIPREHWDFLNDRLVDWFETETHIFVHANLFPELPPDEQPEVMLLWEFLTGPIHHASGKTVVCGHTSQRGGVPKDYGDTICIDTCAHRPDGWLTCLEVKTRRYWQANQAGEVRQGWSEPEE